MGTGRLLTILGVLVLNFIGTIFLETKLQSYAPLELVIIVVAILLSILALIGIASESRWAWPFTTILFSLLLANAVFLQVNIGAFITFVLLLLVNIFGLLIAVLSIEDVGDAVAGWTPDASEDMPLETYAAAAEPKVTYKTQTKVKRGKKKAR